jgi:hypothetical protein
MTILVLLLKKIYWVENGETLNEEGLIQLTDEDTVIGYTVLSFRK